MKKWLVIQENLKIGAYGPEYAEFLRECFSLQYALQENGYEADIWGKDHINYLTPPDFNDYDYIFVEEQYSFDWIPWEAIRKSRATKIQLCGEIHVHQNFFKYSSMFDILLYPFKSSKELLNNYFPSKRKIWYPSAMDGRYYNKEAVKDIEKTIDVGWLGCENRKYVQELKQDIGLVVQLKGGWNYIKTLAATKVGINSRMALDLNYKNFEITGVGTCLVCDYDEAFEEMGFTDNNNCYMFKSYNECLSKIKKALENDNWKSIGENGYILSREHTYVKRFERMKKILENNLEGDTYAV